MRRMMESKYKSIMVKLFMFLIGVFLAIMLFGCDSILSDMEAEHQRLGMIAKQDLQRLSPSPMSSQAETLYPAP